jgi:hypothetical protein
MRTTSLTLATMILSAGGFVHGLNAQTATFYNGGFEAPCPFCGGPFPDGWQSPGGDPIAKRRSVGDSFSPAVFPVGTPGALTPRTGTSMAEIGTNGNGGFEGFTTDTVNFCYCDQSCMQPCSGPFPFFDPFFDYSGGDVVVTGYYMIPADAPLSGDNIGIKINIKLGNQDVATREVSQAFTGHTDGQWVPYSITFPRADIQTEYECNVGIRPNCGCVCVPASPLPNHTKITVLRFLPDGTPSTGRIYWDDITYTQLPAGPTCDSLDFNNDGVSPDTGDIDDFLSVFGGGPCSTDPTPGCNDLDFNNDGVAPDTTDIDSFLSVFGGGPCAG